MKHYLPWLLLGAGFFLALSLGGTATRDKSSTPPHLQGEGRWIDRDTGCGCSVAGCR